ncbi:hypothetical protein [Microbispora sp. NBC_01389]|uniref:hypothetical protein n=1 Tax=Microbispora sp. NBC_01389 TaxID=2903584 RepID=UPI00324F1437
MGNNTADVPQQRAPGWRFWRSDAGRFWATREQPFTGPEMQAGAERTVDADTPGELAEVVAAQEARAEAAQ